MADRYSFQRRFTVFSRAAHALNAARALNPILVLLGLCSHAPAQTGLPPHPIPEAERWATITHPGNEAYTFTDGVFTRTFGRVDYEYQISRTELTGGEWFEFVNAYAPYVSENDANASTFTSRGILRVAPLEYIIAPGAVNRPVEVSWRYAARYINWLHNDKATNREAFEQGAYDTSTFSTNPDGTFNDQQTRSPGARYWLPSEDEWAKAVFWDPNKNGPDQPGYWTDLPP